eukprot:gene3003-5792_t
MALSTRGRLFSQNPEWLETLMDCIEMASKPCDDEEQRVLNVAVAANVLCHDEMEEFVRSFREKCPILRSSFSYYQFEGICRLRSALSHIYNQRILHMGSKTNPSDFIVGNGCGPLLENVVSCLADEYDYILIPSPYYHAFPMDVSRRMQCKIKSVPLSWNEEAASVTLSIKELDKCYDEIIKAGNKVKIMIYTNPHNPTGALFPNETTEKIISWCIEHKIHLISDEIYTFSTFPGAKFTSVFDIVMQYHGDAQQQSLLDTYIHVMWGASKDLGLNGFRIGTLLTRNNELKSCLQGLAYTFATPADIQETVASVLEDSRFLDRFFELNRERLHNAFTKVSSRLRDHGVRHIVQADGAMFVYFRMPGAEMTLANERELWQEKTKKNRVMLLPGFVFGDDRRGWFRICISAYPLEQTLKAVDRIFISVK